MSDNDTSGPSDRQYDDVIAALVLDHPFWTYEQLAEALRKAGIFVCAFDVSWVCGERRP